MEKRWSCNGLGEQDGDLCFPAFIREITIRERQTQIGIGVDVHGGGFAAHEFGSSSGGDHGRIIGGEDGFGIVEVQTGFGGAFGKNFAKAAVGGDAAGKHNGSRPKKVNGLECG